MMSGGVDSSVAAALAKQRGFDVTGIHIKMWSDPSIPCRFIEDRHDAMRAAEHIKIPFETWDLTEEYKHAVVEYMIREYAAGRTPNPDVMCNRHIKFGVVLTKAIERGADFVATGHYIRKGFRVQGSGFRNNESDPSTPYSLPYTLRVAQDAQKDQSYFLWTLTQEQLKYCLFPIGEYTKPEVRETARMFGLPTAEKKDSQGICFIGEIDVREFLKKHIPASHGAMITTSGRVVGEHEGTPFYTIGQRHGLGIGGRPDSGRDEPRRGAAGGIPYYVGAKDPATNTLTVAQGPYDELLFSRQLKVADVHWISGAPAAFPFACEARIRYRQPLQKCFIEPDAGSGRPGRASLQAGKPEAASLKVKFSDAQRAATPGQSIVFYQAEEMLGGGCINV